MTAPLRWLTTRATRGELLLTIGLLLGLCAQGIPDLVRGLAG